MITQQREHPYGRDCWCNPLIVTAGSRLIAPDDCTVSRYDIISHNQYALHVEPPSHKAPPADAADHPLS